MCGCQWAQKSSCTPSSCSRHLGAPRLAVLTTHSNPDMSTGHCFSTYAFGSAHAVANATGWTCRIMCGFRRLQLATNSGLLIFALDTRNVTSSTRVTGHVVSIIVIQFVGLCFQALRSVLLLPLIMDSLCWNCGATVTDAVALIFSSLP